MASNIPDYIPLPKSDKDFSHNKPFVSLLQHSNNNNNKTSTFHFSKKKQSHAQSAAAKLISRSIIKQTSVFKGHNDLGNRFRPLVKAPNPKLKFKNQSAATTRQYAGLVLQRFKLKESKYCKNNNVPQGKSFQAAQLRSRSKYIKQSMPQYPVASATKSSISSTKSPIICQSHKGRKKNDEDCLLSEDYFWAPGEKESLREDAEQSFRRSMIRIVPKFLFD